MIPWEEWEKQESVSSKGTVVNEDKSTNDEEVALLWTCFENNLIGFANAAQQLKTLSKLLQIKGLTKEQIEDKMKKDGKLRQNLESIYSSTQWIRDIMIDSDYSDTFM